MFAYKFEIWKLPVSSGFGKGAGWGETSYVSYIKSVKMLIPRAMYVLRSYVRGKNGRVDI